MVTTHTPMLARAVADTDIRYIHDKGPSRALATGGGDYANIARSLGVLPDHDVQLFIGVEGPNDIAFLSNVARVLSDAGEAVPRLDSLGSMAG